MVVFVLCMVLTLCLYGSFRVVYGSFRVVYGSFRVVYGTYLASCYGKMTILKQPLLVFLVPNVLVIQKKQNLS
jgi:hypothetical protein